MQGIDYGREVSTGSYDKFGPGDIGKVAGSTLARIDTQFSYEKYIHEIHCLIDQIEKKTRPVCLDVEGMIRQEKPTFPDSGTLLESSLRAIMNRLETINESIIV